MKTTKLISLMAIVILAVSCKKDSSNTSVKQQISLRADGVLFTVTTGGTDVEESDAHIRDGNKFQLDATTSLPDRKVSASFDGNKFQLDATTSTKDFSINNENVPSTGTYNMTGAGTVFNFVQWEDGSELFSSLGTGKSHLTFNITRVAGNSSDYLRYVEGTFSGVIYNIGQTDSVRITEGQISIIE